jgi:hypothetical protein
VTIIKVVHVKPRKPKCERIRSKTTGKLLIVCNRKHKKNRRGPVVKPRPNPVPHFTG